MLKALINRYFESEAANILGHGMTTSSTRIKNIPISQSSNAQRSIMISYTLAGSGQSLRYPIEVLRYLDESSKFAWVDHFRKNTLDTTLDALLREAFPHLITTITSLSFEISTKISSDSSTLPDLILKRKNQDAFKKPPKETDITALCHHRGIGCSPQELVKRSHPCKVIQVDNHSKPLLAFENNCEIQKNLSKENSNRHLKLKPAPMINEGSLQRYETSGLNKRVRMQFAQPRDSE
ncbi:hypothetical protein RF11_16372 [Thelohanellus kitauei]|uniref:Uncharacterized protein n=1 Tax=Thelohanellus kitauei TaxID=669202 RepID=A0A0C2IE46_THEKT|nr:hypothetical protein RF11_16372 [Thelohanellus kitauei]